MKKRPLIGYTAILIIMLILAYFSSVSDKVTESTGDPLISIQPQSVTQVDFLGDKHRVSIQRNPETGRFLITQEDVSDIQDSPKQPTYFLANSAFDKVLDDFAPLTSVRKLGSVEEDEKEKFGLSESASRLKIYTGKTVKLDMIVGKRSYGSREKYVLLQPSQLLALIRSASIDKIEKASTSLIERRVFETSYKLVPQAKVTGKTKIVEFSRELKAGGSSANWRRLGAEGGNNSEDAAYDTWFDRLSKLRVLEFASPEVSLQLRSYEPIFTVDFSGTSSPSEQIQFFKLPTAESTSEVYWVRSSQFGVFAKISSSRMDTIEKDLSLIFGS